MVAQLGNAKLTTNNPRSTKRFENFTRHTSGQVNRAELVKDSNLPDAGGIDACFVCNSSNQVPWSYTMDSTNLDAESFQLARRSSSRSRCFTTIAIAAGTFETSWSAIV